MAGLGSTMLLGDGYRHNLLQVREIRQQVFLVEAGKKLLGSGVIPKSNVGDDILLGHVRGLPLCCSVQEICTREFDAAIRGHR